MSTRFKLQVLKTTFISLLLAVFLVGFNASGQTKTTAPSRELYLLAATPSQHNDEQYPATLYHVSEGKTLEKVREVVPHSDGVRVVRAWDDEIFLLYPHTRVTSVSIVHTDDPQRNDDVVFASQGVFPDTGWTVVAAPPNLPETLLVPWISDASDLAHLKNTVAEISRTGVPPSPRFKFNNWVDFAYFRLEGETNGTERMTPSGVVASGGQLTINFSTPIALVSIPDSLRRSSEQLGYTVIASSQDYLVVQCFVFRKAASNANPTEDLYVRDRARNQWRTLAVDGNASTVRLFGPWLGSEVAMVGEGRQPRGRENERSVSSEQLPNVQQLYANWVAKFTWFPGVLTLQNLDDGRKIRIETDQEDSEILWAGDDSVLYRVNDAIYQAKIVGDKLQETTMVVKDQDVPEIHWVFWGK